MSSAAPPGWYPDPWGEAPQRFWDGWRWTPQVSGPGALVRVRLPEGSPIYGPAIWLLAVLPILSTVMVWFMRIDVPRFVDLLKAAEQTNGDLPMRDFTPLSVLGPGYIVAELLSLALTAVLIVLAYRDHRYLSRLGVVRPFHWAWAFLGSIVYVIGRGVIVRKVAAPRRARPHVGRRSDVRGGRRLHLDLARLLHRLARPAAARRPHLGTSGASLRFRDGVEPVSGVVSWYRTS